MERAGAKEEDCEGLVNYALSIGDVEVAVFFRELPDRRFRVSLRSKGGLDVSAIAQEFGGGGHSCASGCAVDGPLHAAVESVLAKIRSRKSAR
jgi:phosphoesterase RecJ-like protein